MLTGEAKKAYQRGYMAEYMRKYRAGKDGSLQKTGGSLQKTGGSLQKTGGSLQGLNKNTVKLVRPDGVSDDQWTMIQIREKNG